MQINRKKNRNKLKIFSIFLIIVLIVSGLYFWFIGKNEPGYFKEQKDIINVEQVNTSEDVKLSNIQSQKPTRLLIEKLDVDAPIISLGLDSTGAMAAPSTLHEVGWYNKSSRLGESRYSVLLDGHYGTHQKPGVFYKLQDLVLGDAILLKGAEGATVGYRVTEVENVALESVDMKRALTYGSKKETVVIITCDGDYDNARKTYNNRRVIYADRFK